MSTFPAAAYYTGDDAQDEGTVRTALDDQLAATKQLIGAAGVEDITIASGSITPTRGTVRVEGQSAAADDLTTIVTTNLPEGSLLLLSIKDEGHIITVKHGTGAGNTSLAGLIDFAMNKLEQSLLLQRRGTLWYELGRFGREKVHVIGGSGEPAFQNSWFDGGANPSFWKDENGVVHLYGLPEKASVAVSSSLIFTLPAGWRPSANLMFAVPADVGASQETNRVVVLSNGEVSWSRSSAPSTVTVSIDISVASFRAEA